MLKMLPAVAFAPTLVQAVRWHYNLALAPLAALLGVSGSLLGMAAIGQRELPTAALLRLQPLAERLPPPWNQASPPLPAPDGTVPEWPLPPLAPPLAHPSAGPALAARRRHCQARAAALAHEAAPLLARQAQARRLQALLPALAGTLPPADARAARQLPLLAAQVAERLGPAASTTLALLLAHRHALRVEAAQLAAWEVG